MFRIIKDGVQLEENYGDKAAAVEAAIALAKRVEIEAEDKGISVKNYYRSITVVKEEAYINSSFRVSTDFKL